MNLTDEQLARLPKWAQEHVKSLELQVRNLRGQVRDLSAGPEGARIVASDYVSPDFPIPEGMQVNFYLGPKVERHTDVVSVRLVRVRTGLIVMLESGDPSKALHLTPQSSNTVRVRLGEY